MRVALPCLAVSWVVACGAPKPEAEQAATTDAGCNSSSSAIPEDIAARISELRQTRECQPAAFKDFDLEGVWQLASEEEPIHYGPRVRFSNECGAFSASNQTFAYVDSEQLVWGRKVADTLGESWRAFHSCHVDENRLIHGSDMSLSHDGDYSVNAFVAEAFAWPDGEGQGEGLRQLSTWAGGDDDPWPSFRAMNVRVRDGVAYLISREGLRIIDVSDPRAPSDLGFLPARDDRFNDVKVIDKDGRPYCVLASNNRGVVVVDVGNPSQPVEVRRFVPPSGGFSGGHSVFVDKSSGQWLGYFVSGDSFLAVYDMSEPDQPRAVASYDPKLNNDGLWWGFHDLYVEGTRAYINGTHDGLLIVDFGNDGIGRLVAKTEDISSYSHSAWVTQAGGRKVAAHGDEGLGSYLRIIDVDESSPEFMQTIGEFRMRENVSIHNVMAIGERVYVAYYENGVRVFDISDPTQPKQISYYNTWNPDIARGESYEGAYGIDVHEGENLIYVADSESGLIILQEGQ